MRITEEINALKSIYPAVSAEGLKIVINEMIELQTKWDFTPQLFVWGHGGVGKTTIVKQTLNEKGYFVVDLKLSQMSPVSAAGLFYPNVENGETIRLLNKRFKEVYQILQSGGKAAIFFDELMRAHPDTISAIWELVLERTLDGHNFKGLFVIGASNPDLRKVALIGQPFFNRFKQVVLQPDVKEVANYIYSRTNCVHVATLLNVRNDLLLIEGDVFYKATPRLWEFVAQACESGLSTEGFVTNDVWEVFNQVKKIASEMKPFEHYLKHPNSLPEPMGFDNLVIVWNILFQLGHFTTNTNARTIAEILKIIGPLAHKIESFGDDYAITVFSVIRDALFKRGFRKNEVVLSLTDKFQRASDIISKLQY